MNLELVVKRAQTSFATLGALCIGDDFECWTLEDAVRPEKIRGETAIPYGKYEIDVTWSPKFHTYLPILLNVPGFDGVRIHPGNTTDDTEGCLLVGEEMVDGEARLLRSRAAFDKLFLKIQLAKQSGGTVTIEFVPA